MACCSVFGEDNNEDATPGEHLKHSREQNWESKNSQCPQCWVLRSVLTQVFTQNIDKRKCHEKYLESTLQQRRPVGGAGRVPRGKKEVKDIVKIRTFCINQNSTGD